MKFKTKIFRITILIILLIFVETVSKLIILRWPRINIKHGGIESFEPGNYYFKPHHYFILEGNPAYREDNVRINRFGLRGEDFPEKKEDNEIRIFCLGGSTTQSMINDDSKTYPNQLENILNRLYKRRKIRVINAGIGTYTTAETLLSYLFKISHLDPDIIIVYHGINDVAATAFYNEMKPDYGSHRTLWEQMKPPPGWLYRIKRYSNFLKIIFYILYPVQDNIVLYTTKPMELVGDAALKKTEEPGFGKFFRINLERLIKFAEYDGVKVLLVSFLTNKDAKFPDSHVWIKGVERHNMVIKDIAGETGVQYFDFVKYFRDNSSEGIFADDICHFSEKGNIWRAEAIADFVLKKEMLDEYQ